MDYRSIEYCNNLLSNNSYDIEIPEEQDRSAILIWIDEGIFYNKTLDRFFFDTIKVDTGDSDCEVFTPLEYLNYLTSCRYKKRKNAAVDFFIYKELLEQNIKHEKK